MSKKSRSRAGPKSNSKAMVVYDSSFDLFGKREREREQEEIVFEELENMRVTTKKSTKKSSKKKSSKKSHSEKGIFFASVDKNGRELIERIDQTMTEIPADILPEWCTTSSRLNALKFYRKYGEPHSMGSGAGSELSWFANPTMIKELSRISDCESYAKFAKHFLHKFSVIDRVFDPPFMCGQTKEALVNIEREEGLYQSNGLLSITSSHVRFPHVFELSVLQLAAAGFPIFYDSYSQKLTVYGSKVPDLYFWLLLVFSMIEDAGMDPSVIEKRRAPRKYHEDVEVKANPGSFADYWKNALDQHLIRRLQQNNRMRQSYEEEIKQLAFKAYRDLQKLMDQIQHKTEIAIQKNKGGEDLALAAQYDCQKTVKDEFGSTVTTGQSDGLVGVALEEANSININNTTLAGDLFTQRLRWLGMLK